jgi:hypothetical protein
MKLVCLLSVFLISSQASAYTWQAVKVCEGGNLVVDASRELDHARRPYQQLVLRGPAVTYLVSKAPPLRQMVNKKGELILVLFRYDSSLMFFIGLEQGVQLRIWLVRDFEGMKVVVERDDRIGGPRGEIASWVFRNCN